MLAKASSLAADEVIVDLEDAVAAGEKENARKLAVATLQRGPLGRTTALRVNGRTTPWWEDDLRAAAEARPDVVVLPKVESAEDVSAAAELLAAGIGLDAQIETARGHAEAERIAAAGHGLEALVFGPADLAASLGVPVLTIGAGVPEYALARIVAARRALEHGYDGKWVIHPSQIEPVNFVFTPSPAEIERAKRILDAAEGAARFEGDLVDEASRRLAASLLRRVELLA